ncbi:RNA-guided endonuclease InsQ/TnpB family protein [Nostoc sp.]|uniref:RNA-guided endonuclease InsQ/TnpB family protein n=1 Tax=Nostoc sp. TaxID=1180 RepID=UPI003593FFCA
MIGTQKNATKPDAVSKLILNVLGMASNSLYNTGVYLSRQQYFENGKTISYGKLCKDLKVDENYKVMHSQAGQQTLKSVAEAFKSFQALENKAKKGELNQKPKLPHYRAKGGIYQVVYPGQAIKIIDKNGTKFLEVPLGHPGKKYFEGIEAITVPYPKRLWGKPIKELRFIPTHGSWYTEYVYEMGEVSQTTGVYAIGIDPGLNNWVSAVCTNGKSFLVCGKRLKSVNQWWNKTKAALSTAVSKQFGEDAFFTKRMARLTDKRNRQMRDATNKVARQVIDWCLNNAVGTVVFGCNLEQKQNINIGRKNNQNFVQIPTAKLRKRIEQLCELHRINYVETEESYTSKTSFLDGDLIPKFGEKPEGYKPCGKRVKRGMYKTSSGECVNADLNGAANILAKVSTRLGINLSRVGRGCLTQPMRFYA